MNLLALEGSPRSSGNSSLILEQFLKGAEESGAIIKHKRIGDLKIDECNGCLRCNLIKRCSIKGDDWNELSADILGSDILVFAAPLYFHHFPSGMKRVLDRFRSFFRIKITERGLIHTPWVGWKKDIVLISTMGSPDEREAAPLVDLMNYMKEILGAGNRVHFLFGTRLAVTKQVIKSADELKILYPKLGLGEDLAISDHKKNMKLLEKSFDLGRRLGRRGNR